MPAKIFITLIAKVFTTLIAKVFITLIAKVFITLIAKIFITLIDSRYKLQFQKETKKELAESRERAHNPIQVNSFKTCSQSDQGAWTVVLLLLPLLDNNLLSPRELMT